MLTYPIFYYLPFLVLVLSSCFIGKQLIQSSRRSKNWRKNRQAVVQLALVVISFIIGYLPNILYFLEAVEIWKYFKNIILFPVNPEY